MVKDILGSVVKAKAGRDRNRFFVVMATEGSEFVLMADGCTRKIAKPKKKKLMHLVFTGKSIDLNLVPKNNTADAFIRKALVELGYNNKTVSEEG